MPDESRDFGLAHEAVVELGDITAARRVLQPGWRWSEQMRPVVGGQWCQARHVGVVLAGRFGYTFEDGTTLELDTDDVFDIPPGHDGYTLGDDDCVVIEWVGVRATTGFSLSAGNRVLTTLLFTDIVGSTQQAARLGDLVWHELLSQHYEALRAQLELFRGREIASTGDGMLASFDNTAAALHCARAVVRDAQALGVPIRPSLDDQHHENPDQEAARDVGQEGGPGKVGALAGNRLGERLPRQGAERSSGGDRTEDVDTDARR